MPVSWQMFIDLTTWIIVYVIIPLTFIVLVGNYFLTDIYVAAKYRSKGHSWRSIQLNKSVPYNVLCSVCKKLMLAAVGLYCERCSLSACKDCRRKANKKRTCRVISASPDAPFTHHWVKVGFACEDCEGGVSESPGNDFFCCWCHRIVHQDSGEPSETEVCDFGPTRSVIVPPSSVTINRTGIVSIQPPAWADWQPLVVIVNPKSGGQIGEEILSLFRGYLHPIQVLQLGKTALRSILKWIPPYARVLVAGGDGSVSAVLTAITDSTIRPAPAVGILPLGTGNDLSRVLGWGASSTLPLAPLSLIENIRSATPQLIDRWSVRFGRQELFAYNYISIGVDAKVALDFHRARRHPLYMFSSQTINYLIYLFLGTHQAVTQDCHGLEKMLELTLDGENIPLPPLQALLLLNIPSWGAGVDVWNSGADASVPQQSIHDGKFEVLGINSSFHIAQLQVGLSQPIRLGQGSKAIVKLKGNAPMQVDGEPWEQTPCEILMEHAGVASVLRHTETLAI